MDRIVRILQVGLCLLALAGSTAGAAPAVSRCTLPPLGPGEQPDLLRGVPGLPVPGNQGVRTDTVIFGGDDGTGVAVQGGVWDFETPGSNGFQGWTSIDATENPGDYFGRFTEADFIAHGDPCVPIQAGNTGMLWCGIHEDEADLRDFVAGMGYQNEMCQRALSPIWPIDPGVDAVDLAFLYFNDTEPGFDYAYVEVICRDASGELLETYALATLDGVIGSPTVLASFGLAGPEIPAGTLDPATATIQLEVRVEADDAWSDEDGLYDTPCGPFGADDLAVTIGSTVHAFDFEDGPQGWTFERCTGKGAFMALQDEGIWHDWVESLGQACGCQLAGKTLGFVDVEHSPYSPPGLVPGQHEQAYSGIVPRAGYGLPNWNAAVVTYDLFANFPPAAGSRYRLGWRVYPYTSEVNPVPHWSGRHGQEQWSYTYEPFCTSQLVDLSGMADDPLPAAWDSLQFVFEIQCSCDVWGVPPSICTEEGATYGSPLLDNVSLGITRVPDAPPIALIDGGTWIDGFGQNYPLYLEPTDRGNSNIAYDLSMGDIAKNDWQGDSSLVSGPVVTSQAARFLCEHCFRIARKGARQDLIPEYHAWKARLGGDPEQGFLCVLMDSLETQNHTQIWRNKFGTYFHENDPGFDPGQRDYRPGQEILPDLVFVPGTRIEYYYRSYWFNSGAPPAEFYVLGPYEFEILPTMTLVPGEEYTVQWPCVLYVDAYNRGSEPYFNAVLTEAGLSFDRFDYITGSCGCNASLKRDFGGTTYNPGGYGNNGLTLEQLYGYRLVLLSTGRFEIGATQPEDWDLFEEWLAATDCGLGNVRRGIILDGNKIGSIGTDPAQGLAIDFVHNVLGVDLVADNYREYNDDDAYCVYLEPSPGAVFTPEQPGIGLLGNGCPREFDYNVLGVHSGVSNAVGNLRFYSYEGTGTQSYVDYAQVVRRNVQPGVTNWMSVMNGFSLHLLSERGWGGQDCSADSAARVAAGIALLEPMLDWMEDPGDPFEPWRYPCVDTGIEEQPETHLSGPVDFLYPARPSPFHARATIRFSLAQAGGVTLEVFDVTGRRIRTLIDGPQEAGEHTVVWDGADDGGRRLGSGLYWLQLRTDRGYASSRRLLAL
jgi:hypothetical protein